MEHIILVDENSNVYTSVLKVDFDFVQVKLGENNNIAMMLLIISMLFPFYVRFNEFNGSKYRWMDNGLVLRRRNLGPSPVQQKLHFPQ